MDIWLRLAVLSGVTWSHFRDEQESGDGPMGSLMNTASSLGENRCTFKEQEPHS